jgi:hypothetical protein
MLRRILVGVGVYALVLAVADQAWAANYLAYTDRFAYQGTITEFNTLSNAQTGTNPISSFSVGPLDLSLRASNNLALFGVNPVFNFQTAWFYTTVVGGTAGQGNPNNVLPGFVQLLDSTQTTVTSSSGSFGPSLTTFNLSVNGANATSGNTNTPRLGPSPSTLPSQSAGTFFSYSLNAVFTGLNMATPSGGVFVSEGDPAGENVTGTFTGIFNNLGTSPTFNGKWFTFNFTLNNTSFAFANSALLQAAGNPFFMSSYASDVVIPEPASLVLASTSLAFGLAVALRRRRRGLAAVAVADAGQAH